MNLKQKRNSHLQICIMLILIVFNSGCCGECTPRIATRFNTFISFDAFSAKQFDKEDFSTVKIVRHNTQTQETDTAFPVVSEFNPVLSSREFDFELNQIQKFEIIVVDSIYVTIRDIQFEARNFGGVCECPDIFPSSCSLNGQTFDLSNDFHLIEK